MIDIRFKEKIQNGTMCAFVSKEAKLLMGVPFYFIECSLCTGNKQICVGHKSDISEGDIIIAEAECVGVNKGRFSFFELYDEHSKYYNLEFDFGINRMLVDLVPMVSTRSLGFDPRDDKEVKKYLETLLSETMEGYLHIFKLVDGEGC